MVEFNYLMYVIFHFLNTNTFSDLWSCTCSRATQTLTCSFWNTCFLENLALVDTDPGEASREVEKPAKEKVENLIP